jgi:hypothetical protein
MNKLLVAGGAAALVIASSLAGAQPPMPGADRKGGEQSEKSASPMPDIDPQRRIVIREYVVKKNVRPVTIPGEVRVGAAVPADVELVAVPADWGPTLTKYRYVYWNDRVVLVNPGDRRVVHIVD